jgi:hypothetical protein
VKAHTTEGFWKAYSRLPEAIRQQARAAYRLFRDNPHHVSLRFRRVHPVEPIYSVRVGIHYRAVGVLDGDTITWFWIGSHAEYDQLLRQL